MRWWVRRVGWGEVRLDARGLAGGSLSVKLGSAIIMRLRKMLLWMLRPPMRKRRRQMRMTLARITRRRGKTRASQTAHARVGGGCERAWGAPGWGWSGYGSMSTSSSSRKSHSSRYSSASHSYTYANRTATTTAAIPTIPTHPTRAPKRHTPIPHIHVRRRDAHDGPVGAYERSIFWRGGGGVRDVCWGGGTEVLCA